jgi:hypothetical protein
MAKVYTIVVCNGGMFEDSSSVVVHIGTNKRKAIQIARRWISDTYGKVETKTTYSGDIVYQAVLPEDRSEYANVAFSYVVEYELNHTYSNTPEDIALRVKHSDALWGKYPG